MLDVKKRETAGADERTPSRAQYFSWINNTNEGSTEEQTLINLDYFGYLQRTYGMQLDIYAWDAGNLDGASKTYETFTSPKIKAQYPNGYGPCVEAAAKYGIRLGVWGGPDGFGDTPESAAARKEQMVSLCRDFNFALFKFDSVCGHLREDHLQDFIEMMKECRKYSPDLILLNHRLNLGKEGLPYATTFLWEGRETYVDVHIGNKTTAPHHRAYMATLGNTPSLLRLTEDHGVCISSCIDYFEDELIIQAFGRSLILAPEIYGNPWLMRDDEHAKLARIFNLHRHYRDILTTAMLLPGGKHYPEHAVARGTADHRFICCGSTSWTVKNMRVRLDMEIGLAPCEKVAIILHHPYEQWIGEFNYGDVVDVPIKAFRSILVEICDAKLADRMLVGCEYEVLHETDGKVDRIKLVSSTGHITYTDGQPFDLDVPVFDNTLRAPKKLSTLAADAFAEVPSDSDKQLETALFAQNQDSLESRELKRSGETAIPEVKAARNAFFNQRTYKLRGCESRFAFDGREDTFFDGPLRYKAKSQYLRIDGGCLRVDFGDIYDADEIRFTYFDIDTPIKEMEKQILAPVCTYSMDLADWNKTTIESIETIKHEVAEIVKENVHNIVKENGRRRTVTYTVSGSIRYFKMPKPIKHIYDIALYKNGEKVALTAPRVNNLLPDDRKVAYAKELTVNVSSDDFRNGCYLAVALEGTHGPEGAYAILEIDGEYISAADRAPSYPSNSWECAVGVSRKEDNYTYYFPIDKAQCDKDIAIRVLGLDDTKKDYGVDVYLCDKNAELDGIVVDL